MIPERCYLWNKEPVTDRDFVFEDVKVYEQESNRVIKIVRCLECGQLYAAQIWEQNEKGYQAVTIFKIYVPIQESDIAMIDEDGFEALDGSIHLAYQWHANGNKGVMWGGDDYYLLKHPARIIEHDTYHEDMPIGCPKCGWKGTPKESGAIEYYDDLLDVSCPQCDRMLLVVGYPLVVAS